MYKGLYDSFAEHWCREGSTIWLYSDPHFGDEEMKYIRKNYIGDEEQIKRINSKVGKNDVIIFLGDIGNLEYVKHIRGYKVCIVGNHDTGLTKYSQYFNEVYESALIIGPKIILSHEPIQNFPFAVNIHGHDHSNWECNDNMHINVCAEHINYTPVNFFQLIKQGVFKPAVDIHRYTIDNAIKRKSDK